MEEACAGESRARGQQPEVNTQCAPTGGSEAPRPFPGMVLP